MRPTAIFLINLLQDVNVLRPLIIMASRDFGFDVLILVSSKFATRDTQHMWRDEVDELAALTAGRVERFDKDWDAHRHMTGCGVIFAASESSVPAHAVTHGVFAHAPAPFLKVTLQHGYECVGFQHSEAHDRAYGPTASFAADLLCSWQPDDLLSSVAPSQRGRLHVTGPTSVLQAFTGPLDRTAKAPGLVCENLHSVRLNSTAGLKTEFVAAFSDFCGMMARDGREVVLRPHPGGQYVVKNDVAVPSNARINNAPMFRVDMRQYSYGISAPSSVLIDMVLAGVPTAVWCDREGGINTDHYRGLTMVSSAAEWVEFARDATARPQPYLDLQLRFLEERRLMVDPGEVYRRFAAIFASVERMIVPLATCPVPRHRILFVANAHLPTLQVCLERPLAPLVHTGEMRTALLTEPMLREAETVDPSPEAVQAWINDHLDRHAPTAIMFSRYSGPHAACILDWANRRDVPTVFHIDDDLLAVPAELGERKFAYHNAPERLATVAALMTGTDLVYTSTPALRQRMLGYYPDAAIVSGAINCSGRTLRTPATDPARKIGYMGFDHFADLMMVLPALVAAMDRHPDLVFELLGAIPVPAEMERFGERVRKLAPVRDYDGFLGRLVELEWDIGICPLTPTEFNLGKSNNKWIEYTSVGTAVVASANMIYDECCADGCGVLASGTDAWSAALETLISDGHERAAMVRRAQHKLERDYGHPAHRDQILNVLKLAREQRNARAATRPELIEETA